MQSPKWHMGPATRIVGRTRSRAFPDKTRKPGFCAGLPLGHVRYVVEVQLPCGDIHVVQRRFREFFELRQSLGDRFPGAKLPPKALVKLGRDFQEERQHALSAFLVNLVRADPLITDSRVQRFLGLENAPAWGASPLPGWLKDRRRLAGNGRRRNSTSPQPGLHLTDSWLEHKSRVQNFRRSKSANNVQGEGVALDSSLVEEHFVFQGSESCHPTMTDASTVTPSTSYLQSSSPSREISKMSAGKYLSMDKASQFDAILWKHTPP
mmetsp:Transcript_17500/g.40166  ORF Transcript_17500/g.40166 Transcript_17500/m.40166 type:complete len:265 (+) Transcript_17500:41-835(+)